MTDRRLLAAALRGALYAPQEPSPFALPARKWTLIGQRVYFVNDVNRGGPYWPFTSLASFGALFTACTTWRTSTFPRLTALSSKVIAYARETVPVLYGELAAAASRDDVDALARIVTQLQSHADAIALEADGVASEVKTFVDANTAFDRDAEKSPSSLWLSLLVRPAELDEAVQKLNGVWQAIAKDLHKVNAAIIANLDTLLEADIDAAAASWRKYAEETSQFTAGTVEQQRVIDGRFVTPVISIRKSYDFTRRGPDGGPAEAMELQSAGPLPVAAGDRLILFGVPPLDGRVTVLRVNAPNDPSTPRYNARTMRWGYVIDTTTTPSHDSWQYLYDRWMPVPSVLNFGGFVFDCAGVHGSARSDDGHLVVRTGDEAEFPPGEPVFILRYTERTSIRERRLVTNDAGDRFWEYTLEQKYTGAIPPCVWAGMYRDES